MDGVTKERLNKKFDVCYLLAKENRTGRMSMELMLGLLTEPKILQRF